MLSAMGSDAGVLSLLDQCCSWLERHIEWAKGPLLAGLFLIAASVTIACPDLGHFANWKPTWGERALGWKMRHPLSVIPVEQFAEPGPSRTGISDHLRKQIYRLAVPVLAY